MVDWSFKVVHYNQTCKYVEFMGQESFKVGQRRQSPVIQGFKSLQLQAKDGRRLSSIMSGKDSQVFNEIS